MARRRAVAQARRSTARPLPANTSSRHQPAAGTHGEPLTPVCLHGSPPAAAVAGDLAASRVVLDEGLVVAATVTPQQFGIEPLENLWSEPGLLAGLCADRRWAGRSVQLVPDDTQPRAPPSQHHRTSAPGSTSPDHHTAGDILTLSAICGMCCHP